MTATVGRAGVVLFSLCLCMCGGAMATNAPTSSPAAAPSGPGAPSAPADASAQPAAQSPAGGMQFAPGSTPMTAAPAPVAPTPASDTPAAREVQRAAVRAELERAQRDLQASANDCASACRALASMERATTHLCALADQADDQRRCEDARQRLISARDHVRQTCGACTP